MDGMDGIELIGGKCVLRQAQGERASGHGANGEGVRGERARGHGANGRGGTGRTGEGLIATWECPSRVPGLSSRGVKRRGDLARISHRRDCRVSLAMTKWERVRGMPVRVTAGDLSSGTSHPFVRHPDHPVHPCKANGPGTRRLHCQARRRISSLVSMSAWAWSGWSLNR